LERGVDPAPAVRWTRVKLDEVLAKGRGMESPLEELLSSAEAVRAYVESQVGALDSLIDFVCEGVESDVVLVLPDRTCGQVFPSNRAAERTRRVNVLCALGVAEAGGSAGAAGAQESADHILERFGSDVGVEVAFDASAWMGFPERLVATVRHAAECGCSGVSFGRFGLIPAAGFNVLRQAIRFASRQSA
jgi:hypothetical protein